MLLRVTPGVEAHTHEFVRTGQDDSKFGFTVSTGDAAQAVDASRSSPAVDLVGLHMHIGSQVFVADFFRQAVEVMRRSSRELRPARAVGRRRPRRGLRRGRGGPDDHAVGQLVREACEDAGVTRRAAEPGRSIVAAAAVTLYTVGTVKEIPASAPTCRSTAA